MKKYAVLLIALGANVTFAQSGISKGSDAESRILRPAPMSIPISKKKYEENLKKQGKTLDSELKRVTGDNDIKPATFVGNDGFINSSVASPSKVEKNANTGSNAISILGVPRTTVDGKIDLNEAKNQQTLQEIEEAKKAAKVEGVEEGANAEYFEKMADEKLKKSLVVLNELEKLLYTKKVLMTDYERVEKQVQLMNILVDAKYSKEVSRKAELVKVKAYFIMRQMMSFVLEDSLKGYRFHTLGDNSKVLKVYYKGMNSKEVLGLKSVTENAFSIGFEKVFFTDNLRYSLEEDVNEYVKKIKAQNQPVVVPKQQTKK